MTVLTSFTKPSWNKTARRRCVGNRSAFRLESLCPPYCKQATAWSDYQINILISFTKLKNSTTAKVENNYTIKQQLVHYITKHQFPFISQTCFYRASSHRHAAPLWTMDIAQRTTRQPRHNLRDYMSSLIQAERRRLLCRSKVIFFSSRRIIFCKCLEKWKQ